VIKSVKKSVNADENSALWISLDIDSMCESMFKSTGTPEPDGISLDFINQFL